MNRTCTIIFGVLSISFLVTTLIWHHIMSVVLGQLILSPNSVAYKMWKNLPVPIYMDMYVYDWVNAEEFERDPKGTRPIFKEVGPFVYEEIHKRANVSWSEDGSTISYNQSRTWIFIPEKSADLSTNVTNLNMISLTVAQMCRDDRLFRTIANVLINRYESLFVTSTAEDWLFNGITHPLLELVKYMKNFTDVPIPIPYDKFGWFYDRNESTSFEGRFEMYTGAKDIYEMGNLLYWKDMNKTDYFLDECAVVKGSAGELLAPIKKFQTSISSFSSDLCSYMTLNQNGTSTVEGITGNLYESDESVFDNGELYPENRCFCVGECPPRGARDVTSCKYGSPAFVSFPHFYLSDPVYTENIDGLSPDREKHSFQIKLDPKTGIALSVQAGIQVNTLIQPYSWCKIYKNSPKMYVPMLWFKQTATTTPLLSFLLKSLHFFTDYGNILFFALAEVCFIAFSASWLSSTTIGAVCGSIQRLFKPTLIMNEKGATGSSGSSKKSLGGVISTGGITFVKTLSAGTPESFSYSIREIPMIPEIVKCHRNGIVTVNYCQVPLQFLAYHILLIREAFCV